MIGDEGVATLARAVASNSRLKELHLSNNLIGDAGAAALGESQSELEASLATLNLGHNMIGEEGARRLASVRPRQCNPARIRPIARSVHAACHIRDGCQIRDGCGVVHPDHPQIAQAIATRGQLRELLLAGNAVGDAGTAALADALKADGPMTVLDLDENGIGDIRT